MEAESYTARLRRVVEDTVRRLRISGRSYYTVSVKINRVKRNDGAITVEGEYYVEGVLSVIERGRFRITLTDSLNELLDVEFSYETRDG